MMMMSSLHASVSPLVYSSPCDETICSSGYSKGHGTGLRIVTRLLVGIKFFMSDTDTALGVFANTDTNPIPSFLAFCGLLLLRQYGLL